MGVGVGKPRLPLEIGGSITYELREELRMELERIGKIELRVVEVQISPHKVLQERFGVVGVTPAAIKDFSLKIGESLFGSGAEVAHIDLLIGLKSGPVGEALARSAADPTTRVSPGPIRTRLSLGGRQRQDEPVIDRPANPPSP